MSYSEQFLVKCEICEKKFRVINALHLRKHDITIAEYKLLYPEAELSHIPCEECGIIITNARSSSIKYCKKCKAEKETLRLRKLMREKKRRQQRNVSKEDREIIGNHHYPGLGTGAPSTWVDEIIINGEKRIAGALWLEKWRKKHGYRGDIRTRSEEISDPSA